MSDTTNQSNLNSSGLKTPAAALENPQSVENVQVLALLLWLTRAVRSIAHPKSLAVGASISDSAPLPSGIAAFEGLSAILERPFFQKVDEQFLLTSLGQSSLDDFELNCPEIVTLLRNLLH